MATKKTPSKKAKPTQDGARDRFGNRTGTQAAAINAALTSKPQTAAAVAETTGLNAGRISGHFKWLLERGFVTATEECLPPPQRAGPKPHAAG